MNIADLIHIKTHARDTIKSQYNLPKRSKIMVGVHFGDHDMSKKLIDGLAMLPANFIIFGVDEPKKVPKNMVFEKSLKGYDMTGIDAMLCSCRDVELEKVMKLGVVPIVNEKNYLGKILKEFNPSRAEGNAYLYEGDSYWSAFYALIRYLENHNFPYDNRNLVKNVSSL